MLWGLPDNAAALREKVLAFCEAELPDDIKRKVALGHHIEKDDFVRWQKIMHRHGFMGGHWPKAYGGQDWSPIERWVAEQTMAEAGAPWLIPTGVAYVGPVIYTFGSDAQKERFLPPILSTDHWWAQGYSEPGAGSDLAALKTKAQRQGDSYIVNGQKIWTTYAQWADWIFCLVRTETGGRPQDGISFLLIDMTSPGIEVRPIQTIDEHHHVNEVFFDNVSVPAENLVGEENKAWAYSKFLLGHERLISGETGKTRRLLRTAKEIAAEIEEGGKPLSENPEIAARLTDCEIALRSLEGVCVRLLSQADGDNPPGVEANIMKVLGTELLQKIQDLMADCVARRGLPFDPAMLDPGWNGPTVGPAAGSGMLSEFLLGRATTIWGGSNEIQRNILAKAALRL